MVGKLNDGRRAFLATSSGLAAALGFGRLARAAAPEVDPVAKVMCDAAGYDNRAAARIAQFYWATENGERDAVALTAHLRERAAGRGTACASPEQMTDGLRHCIREDFKAGRTVTIDGWVLSETETRLCALKTLLAPS